MKNFSLFKNKSFFTLLGMLFICSIACKSFAGGSSRVKQSCKKQHDASWTTFECSQCDNVSLKDNFFKLWCCKKTICTPCAKKVIFDSLSEILDAGMQTTHEGALYARCPSSSCTHPYLSSMCLNLNNFDKIRKANPDVNDLYNRACELIENKNMQTNQLEKHDAQFCNKCNKTSPHYSFSNCSHTFCLSCYEGQVFKHLNNVMPWVIEVASGREVSIQDIAQQGSAYAQYDHLGYSMTAGLDKFFGCSYSECNGAIANVYQVLFLTTQSQKILELGINYLQAGLDFFDSAEKLDSLLQEIHKINTEKNAPLLERSQFDTDVLELKNMFEKELASQRYKLSLLNIYE